MGAVAEGARTGANAAATGISMLNPQRWGGVGGSGSSGRAVPQSGYGVAGDDYSGGAAIFELGDDDDDTDGGKDKRSSVRSIETISSLGTVESVSVMHTFIDMDIYDQPLQRRSDRLWLR